jgi:hypothetical protein
MYTAGQVDTAAAHFGTGICISQNQLWETAAGAPGESAAVTLLNLTTNAQTTITPDGGSAGLTGCALDHAGNLYLADYGVFEGIEIYDPAGNFVTGYPLNAYNAITDQGFSSQELAIDGLGNSFLATYVYDYDSDGTVGIPGTFVEYTSAGTQISPTYGYAPTTGVANASNTGLIGLTPVEIIGPGGVAVDGSGNLWLSGVDNGLAMPNYVTEVIGIAAPVVTPKSTAITNNQIATRP